MKKYTFLQEDTIGYFNSAPLLYISVYSTDPGNIPHFHVYSKDNKIDSCIEICDNRYFIHGIHKGILNSKYSKLLQEFLLQKPLSPKGKNFQNNWYYIVKLWNSSNRGVKVPSNQKMPDYTTIKQERKS